MVSTTILALLVSALASSVVSSSNYTLTKDYMSDGAFFDQFTFFTGPDPTHGFVNFLSFDEANATSLAGFVNTGAGNAAYMAVSGEGITPNGRPSVRISSNDTYNHALFVADIAHMPEGCSLWPSLWALGTSSAWPNAGEIDIIESVNLMTSNKMTLHTNAGVTLANTTSSMTGTIVTDNCDVDASNDNAGCQIADPTTMPSFGVPFNKNQGGVFATEYTSEAIRIWFFPRGNIPTDVSAGTPNPSSWPEPNALFENASGNLDSHFCELQIIFDMTLCGDWAGNADVWQDSGCAALADSCTDYVANNPSGFTEAFWIINSLQVFQDPSQGLGLEVKRSHHTRHGGAVLPL